MYEPLNALQDWGHKILEKCGNCPMAIAIIADVLYREIEENPEAGSSSWADVLRSWDYNIKSRCNPHEAASNQAETVQGAIQLSLDRLPRVSLAASQLELKSHSE